MSPLKLYKGYVGVSWRIHKGCNSNMVYNIYMECFIYKGREKFIFVTFKSSNTFSHFSGLGF